MKNSGGFNQPNRILSFLRFGSGVILISAAAAMAFVAVNPSGPLLVGKTNGSNQPKLQRPSALPIAVANHLRERHGDLSETSLYWPQRLS